LPENIHPVDSDLPVVIKATGSLRQVNNSTVHYKRTIPGPLFGSCLLHFEPPRLKTAQMYFTVMFNNGRGRHSESPWSSELYIVPEKNLGLRACGNYKAFNACTIPDRKLVRHLFISIVILRVASFAPKLIQVKLTIKSL
jgi:hypothetical protein